MSIQEFSADSKNFLVTESMHQAFADHGYILIRGLFNKAEVTRIKSVLENNRVIEEFSYTNRDDNNRESRLCIWNQPGNDVTGMVARCKRVAGTCQQLLDEEVYHYHTKLMMKEARTGGSFVWHQDYGYWYQNGCLNPNMMTAFIALDPCYKENGCLQILSGSHQCGRVEHVVVGQQVGADLDRVEHIRDRCPHLYVEMTQGDVLFFHCNLLHTSSANTSSQRRWALLCAYNTATNSPDTIHLHPNYSPLSMVDDSSVLDCTIPWDHTNKDVITKEKRDKLFKNDWK